MPYFDFTEWAEVDAIERKYVLLKTKKYIYQISAAIRAWSNNDPTREVLD